MLFALLSFALSLQCTIVQQTIIIMELQILNLSSSFLDTLYQAIIIFCIKFAPIKGDHSLAKGSVKYSDRTSSDEESWHHTSSRHHQY